MILNRIEIENVYYYTLYLKNYIDRGIFTLSNKKFSFSL